ncbi:hypothetical protein DL546_007516 [Coniochaeta pulveracea]|uniref:Uncharacterized protein n=1 Tax=Coniochaeta pulveracea TaxID=177199 RepID=A0A420YK77_9PEZI|nr:hypothetical protein DL546_007516 [Coniochaeta pulveracea]
MIAQERAQQELRYASQQAKENRVNNPQQDLTPSSGVRRQNPKKTTVKATGMPVAEKTPVRPAEEIAVHSMQSQTPEALHEHRVKDWWFTNPYGDQSQLYLPGSGVPPGVKLCHEGECVACEKTEA